MPGFFGSGIRALARFAVPFFILTAGYFNLGASTRSLLRRAGRTGKQLVLSSLPYLVLGAILAVRQGTNLWTWLKPFFTTKTLWWAISTLADAWKKPVPYDALAILSVVLLLLHLVFGEGFGLMGKEINNQILRNAMLDGFPFFALGSWAAWRRRTIKAMNLPWHWLILGGGALSLLEAKLAGRQELYLGTYLLLAGMMGRCIRYRRASQGRLSRGLQFCGQELTLDIFVLHMLVVAAVREVPALAWLNGLTWLLPPAVAAVSTLLALLAAWARANFRRERDFV